MTRFFPIFSSVLTLSLAMASPATVMAHVGHGDEFQATGGINRVEVKAETDALLGIRIAPIETTADSGEAVLIPVTATVEDNGRQIVFVQHENFYEPVEIIMGETQGDLVEVTEGLSLGEQLVTEGGLALYAESRKTQTAEGSESDIPSADTLTEEEHARADAEGIPHSHGEGHGDEHHDDSSKEGGISKTLLAAIGGGAGLLVGAVFLAKGSKGESSN